MVLGLTKVLLKFHLATVVSRLGLMLRGPCSQGRQLPGDESTVET